MSQHEDMLGVVQIGATDVERAAIAEFDGNVPRTVAESIAEKAAVTLWPHQQSAINKLRDVLQTGIRRIVLYGPTGSGKTETTGGIIKAAKAKGKRVLFVCHLKELIAQTSARFYRMDIPHGILQAENTRGLYNDVIVGSIQTYVCALLDKAGKPLTEFAGRFPDAAAALKWAAALAHDDDEATDYEVSSDKGVIGRFTKTAANRASPRYSY